MAAQEVDVVRYGNRLLHTAVEYARVGVPVAPAFPTIRPSTLSARWRRKALTCGCWDNQCECPGAHPLHIDWQSSLTTKAVEVDRIWNTPHPPNLLIATGGVIEGWEVPEELGETTVRLMEVDQPYEWPPMLQVPSGRWIFLTAPYAGDPSSIVADGEAVRRLGDGSYVVVPPSRRPGCAASWQWSPHFPLAPLPDADRLISTLLRAVGRLGVC